MLTFIICLWLLDTTWLSINALRVTMDLHKPYAVVMAMSVDTPIRMSAFLH